MIHLLKNIETDIFNIPTSFYKNDDILCKEKELIKKLNEFEHYFSTLLHSFKLIIPSFEFKTFKISTSINSTISISTITSQPSISFSFSYDNDIVVSKYFYSFSNEEEYNINKEIESLFLKIDKEIIKKFFIFENNVKSFSDTIKTNSKLNYQSKVNLIKQFFEGNINVKDNLKSNMKRNISGYHLLFSEQNNIVILEPYNFEYSHFLNGLTLNNTKTSYKKAKSFIDSSIVYNDIFIESYDDIQKYLGLFEYQTFTYFDGKQNFYHKKILCDIDKVIEFINCSLF